MGRRMGIEGKAFMNSVTSTRGILNGALPWDSGHLYVKTNLSRNSDFWHVFCKCWDSGSNKCGKWVHSFPLCVPHVPELSKERLRKSCSQDTWLLLFHPVLTDYLTTQVLFHLKLPFSGVNGGKTRGEGLVFFLLRSLFHELWWQRLHISFCGETWAISCSLPLPVGMMTKERGTLSY